MDIWESHVIPSHLIFEYSNSFKFHTNSINIKTKLSNYLKYITFQNLEFWDVTMIPVANYMM